MQHKLHGLDHLRALAITFVFFFHYSISIFGHPAWLPDLTQFGWTGVDLFFVLSGFLISSQLFYQIKRNGEIAFNEFFLKRFFRILPAYWVVVTIYFCLPFFREKEVLPSLWKFLIFTQNLGLNLKDTGTFSHAWSLCVEEHFYFLLPIILFLLQFINFTRKALLILPVFFVIGFICRMYSWNHFYMPHIEAEDSWMWWYKFMYYPTYNRLDGLLIGVSLAALFQFAPATWSKISKYGNTMIFLSLLVLTAAYFLCNDALSYSASIGGFPLVALGYGLLVAGAISPGSSLYQWQSKGSTFIATLSYAIYLTHKGVIHLTQSLVSTHTGLNKDSILMMLICIFSCAAAGLALNLLIEKPFLNLRAKITGRA